ncbi:sialate O-acetylesterase [Prosthecobacter sp.]|uniref:sialate O-acetylesterase n=1 Tax=Prosthecobacter sp. TaxID=1965333 RepID=UPI002AB91352|nr:sialate O-acetylesterase [Prosthecobacter sp.]MDZ4402338.1 sialate O-acetylesterase [Prosthecobacter sp.]
MRTSFFILFVLGLALSARATVSLPVIFTDHMVLQRERPVPVWGWAEAGREVNVKFAGQTKTTKADKDGRWKVTLDPLKASNDRQNLMVSGQNTVVVKDVLVGEVWLCSGQSNMAMTVKGVQDAEKEMAAANFPKMRMFFVQSFTATSPQEQCKGVWQACSPQTILNFSAAAYFFGRDLHQTLKVPVGLINSSVGGTAIESWTSLKVMEKQPELQPLLEQWRKEVALFEQPETLAKNEAAKKQWQDAVKAAQAASQPPPPQPPVVGRDPLNANRPGNLFNGKIAPIVPFAIRGAIWYQGESNAGNGPLYATQLPLMIRDWRTRWGNEFSFAWVQLPNFLKRETEPRAASTWARLREAQSKSLAVPNTGMTINLDIGEAGNIHPLNKQEIGRRLALWARAKVYGEKIPWSGPLYQSHAIKGNQVVIQFQHADGLKTADGSAALKGFAMADATQKWQWAEARIEGGQVIVSHPGIQTPVAVRYAWANNPEVNLINGAGLPAGPFRTDDWPMDNASMPLKAGAP